MPNPLVRHRRNDVIAQVALNRPRSVLAKVLWLMLVVYGCIVMVTLFALAAR